MSEIGAAASAAVQAASEVEGEKILADVKAQVQAAIGSYLGQLNAVYNQVAFGESTGSQLGSIARSSGNLQMYSALDAARQQVRDKERLAGLMKNGYRVIHHIREIIAAPITYEVGVEYEGSVYHAQLSLDQILSFAKLEFDKKGGIDSQYKLRLKTGKTTVLEAMLGAKLPSDKKERKIALQGLEINDYATYNKMMGSKRQEYTDKYGKTPNAGNLYEAYVLKKTKSNYSYEKSIYSVMHGTQSFAKGGDIDNMQVKFFGDAPPSLASIASIRSIMTDIQSALNSTNIQKSLKPIFVEGGKSAGKAADKAADKILKECIQILTG